MSSVSLSDSPIDKARLGVITPLYVSPQQNLPAWIQLASIARRYPRIHTIAVVDVRRGPGLGPDTMYQYNISMLKENNVTVLGYVETDLANAEMEDMKQSMKNWKNWYPDIDGFYFAHVPRDDNYTQFYADLTTYAKGYLECKFLAAEFSKEFRPVLPHQFIISSHIDLFISYRDRTVPAPIDVLKDGIEEDRYQAHRFGIILTKLPTTAHSQRMTENFVRQAISHNVARYFYFHTDDGAREMHPDPFQRISEFLEVTVSDLDKIADGEAILPAPPEPTNPTEFYVKNDQVITTSDGVGLADRGLIGDNNNNVYYDKFGIKKIHPNIEGEREQEWYFKQEGDPTKDPQLRNWKNAGLRRMQDGSRNTFMVTGVGSKGQVRLEAWSISPTKRWLNTESTVFFKYLRDNPIYDTGKYGAQVYTRSGHHSSTRRGGDIEGACYKAAVIKSDGRTTLRKEVAHEQIGDFYCGNRATQPAINAHPVKGYWVGLKHIVYNIVEDGKTLVVTETYVLQNCTGRNGELVIPANQDWKLTSKFIDRGYWGLDKAEDERRLASLKLRSLQLERAGQLRKSTDIINTSGGPATNTVGVGGNCSCFRSDGVEIIITNWSIREIKVDQTD